VWIKLSLTIIIAVIVVIGALLLYGVYRWNARTQALLDRLDAARVPSTVTRVDLSETRNLPPPVQRFFRAALTDGAVMPSAATVSHAGTFNMGQDSPQWKPFTSQQRTVFHAPGFVWDARVAMMPGLSVHVHDAYVAGEGILNPAIAGLVSLADMRGGGDIAQGELMRYFAETAMYPTALLPSQGVRWEAVDDHSARASMTDRGITLTLLFRFGSDHLIESIRAEARGRTVGDKVIPTPWEGRWFSYALQSGMQVPMEGEVAWVLPEGPLPSWRGRIPAIPFEP
jgi:hypothetical protein